MPAGRSAGVGFAYRDAVGGCLHAVCSSARQAPRGLPRGCGVAWRVLCLGRLAQRHASTSGRGATAGLAAEAWLGPGQALLRRAVDRCARLRGCLGDHGEARPHLGRALPRGARRRRPRARRAGRGVVALPRHAHRPAPPRPPLGAPLPGPRGRRGARHRRDAWRRGRAGLGARCSRRRARAARSRLGPLLDEELCRDFVGASGCDAA
mmetsp:Transcript_27475/g.78610  ORF Transcript_27475/g.78610 Transcript_27475/m.78610 type:complete len:208 (+) Transcript_27475:420-1043(+)